MKVLHAIDPKTGENVAIYRDPIEAQARTGYDHLLISSATRTGRTFAGLKWKYKPVTRSKQKETTTRDNSFIYGAF